ncbi:MAG: FAD-dependent oxidoreductase [Proteobacteria bacterium]|nr:FAD-dependent oxidoreductase [Pseudomonadota bacterium]
MARDRTFVIAGAGHAGGRAAEAMRSAEFDGRIVLIGEENYPPYERPPLSKELLRNDDGVERTFLNPAEFYAGKGIEHRPGTRVEGIEAAAHRLRLGDGETLDYDKLLLTTGGRVRRLTLPGAELDGVHYLRGIDDSLAIRKTLVRDASIVIIGGGFIGLEVAASARARGCAVSVIEMQDALLGRVADPEIGRLLADVHGAHGVEVLTGVGVERIEGEDRVRRVVCSGGAALDADAVVVGIGIIPNADLAEEAGLEVDNGIVVDVFGQTSDPDIHAAGDVANHPNPILGHRVRLESWQNAQNQGVAVARNMCGLRAPYAEVPWFWSDQFDINLQMAGAPESWDRLVWRGDPASNRFIVFYMNGDVVVAVNAFNLGREVRIAKFLIERKTPVADADLADEGIKLRDLAR